MPFHMAFTHMSQPHLPTHCYLFGPPRLKLKVICFFRSYKSSTPSLCYFWWSGYCTSHMHRYKNQMAVTISVLHFGSHWPLQTMIFFPENVLCNRPSQSLSSTVSDLHASIIYCSDYHWNYCIYTHIYSVGSICLIGRDNVYFDIVYNSHHKIFHTDIQFYTFAYYYVHFILFYYMSKVWSMRFKGLISLCSQQ